MELNNDSKQMLYYIYNHPYVPCLQLLSFKNKGVNRETSDETMQFLINSGLVSCKTAPYKESEELPYDGLSGHLVVTNAGK